MKYSYLIVGAGCTGAVIAREIADKLNETTLVIDRRNHISGNAFDHYDKSGVLVHEYGPHIFHTNSHQVWEFLSKFTEWNPYEHRVIGKVGKEHIPIPFNFSSIETMFSSKEANIIKSHLLEEHGNEVKVPILNLMKSKNRFVKELADYVYTNIFFNYTKKMWDLEPQELDPAVLSRVPIQIGYDDRYFHDKYQSMPKNGYTKDEVTFGNLINKELSDWYTYRTRTHNIESKNNVYLIKLNNNRFMKMRILNYYCGKKDQDCRTIMCSRQQAACLTVEYVLAENGTDVFPISKFDSNAFSTIESPLNIN